MKYYIYNTQGSNGIRVIVDNLIEAFKRKNTNLIEIRDLEMCNKEDVVFPMCLKECLDVYKKGLRTDFGLLMDAISLGYRNKIKFYVKNGYIFHYDFFYSIYGYLRYSKMEKKVVSIYKNLMLVSQVDINYLKNSKENCKCNFLCVPNGASFNVPNIEHSYSPSLRLGLLSSWVTKQTFDESAWFVYNYFYKLAKRRPQIKLYIAGRGSLINRFKGLKNVVVLGAVDSLSDFFSQIDLFVSANPKGCGILNRILDTIAYKVPIIGVPGSFTGFANSQDIFIRFEDYETFEHMIDMFILSPNESKNYAEKAYQYALVNNSWKDNYDKFVDEIFKIYDNEQNTSGVE